MLFIWSMNASERKWLENGAAWLVAMTTAARASTRSILRTGRKFRVIFLVLKSSRT